MAWRAAGIYSFYANINAVLEPLLVEEPYYDRSGRSGTGCGYIVKPTAAAMGLRRTRSKINKTNYIHTHTAASSKARMNPEAK